MKIAQECGQKWWRFNSWFPLHYEANQGSYRNWPKFRKLEILVFDRVGNIMMDTFGIRADVIKSHPKTIGFAFGPIMFLYKE